MGEYNPHVPQILGQEWVPIRDEDATFSPSINSMETGHAFRTTQSRILQSMRYYVDDAASATTDQVFTTAIYARGTEAATGPIQRVLIPVNNGGITGSGVTFNSAIDVASALTSADDQASIRFAESGVTLQKVGMFFATNSYPQLNGKRILAVNFRYVFGMDPRAIATTNLPSFLTLVASNGGEVYGNLSDDQGPFDPVTGSSISKYGLIRMGEINPCVDTTSAFINRTSERLPWNWAGLQRLEASAANRLQFLLTVQLNFDGNTDGTTAYFSYAALEVLFCEERRLIIASGKRSVASSASVNDLLFTGIGVSTQPARAIGTYALNPTLPAGDYVVTVSSPELGTYMSDPQFPELNALREYYAIPTHPGVQVNIPAPVDETKVGLTFASEQTHVLPQISVHTSGGPLTEVHAYGRQAVAQVYGTITATQEILDSAAGASYTWPQVRYYARRFGNTTAPLLLDSPTITGAGNRVSITPGEWDALDEIIDGWKEVTLRFPTPPAMGAGTNPQWRWSSAGELAGNRWEVLGCIAPALSGTPGNLFSQVPSPHQLSSATYGAPNSGATINMGWMPQYAPAVTATSDDQTTDAVLIFSQDPPAITGFSVIQTSQAISGIGFDCGSEPCCIPSAIWYHRLRWSAPTGSTVLLDTFSRSATGWGTADSGQTYTDAGGTVPGNYIVNGTNGTHVLDGVANVNRLSTISGSFTDLHLKVKGSINVAVAGASMRTSIVVRYTDANNFDVVDFRWATNGNLEIVIANVAAGVQTALTNVNAGAYLFGQQWYFDVDVNGTQIRAKAWPVDSPEPSFYQAQAATSITSGGYGIRSIRSTGNTNTDAIASYDDFTVSPSTWNFGSYELQRFDDIDNEWQTIMLATNPAVTGFSDFEARVGILSSYRIRLNNVYNFSGPWSSTVTETVDEPGVTIGTNCSDGHLLIFTSNSRQDGSINLAHSSIWEGTVNEDFEFPEAGDVVLQKMYGKDFVTAFRPLERGGERFTRTILVQAAAIAPETLADFTDLRDMAWDTVPYICVRDEDGNRWYATIIVPSGRVQLNRTLYMAPVSIIEVTDEAFPVDP
jgi:hypothetical protein